MMGKRLDIAEQLRRALEQSTETQYSIAKGAGVNWSVLNRFITGERDITLSTAAKLCEYFRLRLAQYD